MVVAALLQVGASVMNGGSGTGVVDFFHGLQVAIMMTLMFNLVQFVWWTCKRMRRGTFWQVHSPTMTVLLSAVMVNIQPMMILVIGSWHLCCGKCEDVGLKDICPGKMSYPPWPRTPNVPRSCNSGGNVFWDESYCAGGNYALFPTQPQGWVIQIVCTWGGFVLMFIGVFNATKLHRKLLAKWRAITRTRASN
jgi:hypothetical protein|mmetsp:Transcript_116287/g.182948  ORF Transcript_116287/g.182948 Transcript_116287/m.182948 type:complete len:193 (+) Transcript_116287:282-860(+)